MSDVSAEPQVATVTCPVCGNVVPVGAFCAACGTHWSHDVEAPSARRAHSYVAAPGESVLHLSVVSSLFPHLSHRSRGPFRLGLAAVVVALLVLAGLRLQAPAIAVSALGIPLLFQLYIYEANLYDDEPVFATLLTIGVGAVLGVGWSLLTSHYVTSASRLTLLGGGKSGSTTTHIVLATLVPAGSQLLMVVPVGLMWALRRNRYRESMDGFVFGSAGALGFVAAAVITDLAPELHAGARIHGSTANLYVQTVVHGIALPLVAACATGLIGAALWLRRDGAGTPGRVFTLWPVALAVAVVVQVGLGYADVSTPGNAVVLVAHLAAAAAYLVALRVGLHHVLLHEAHDIRIGPPRVCHHCHHVVPAAPFCPNCGAAEVAVSRASRRQLSLETPAEETP
jgi:RNA polymerase subunit RPABC4/transcription elongation factor Spt4